MCSRCAYVAVQLFNLPWIRHPRYHPWYHANENSQCDFAIHDAVDLGLSVEEAEERSRPFVCAVGAGCLKRYRQMNGLKVRSYFWLHLVHEVVLLI